MTLTLSEVISMLEAGLVAEVDVWQALIDLASRDPVFRRDGLVLILRALDGAAEGKMEVFGDEGVAEEVRRGTAH